ncbi:MAG: serine/threonine protein kinase [Deltaproteobacteria bacterium]|nr:serine/threonine protein kinase [Deltaproteobacteria bacterium]MBW1874532.1 serine/threonine protein kinase [Deltaproteobacteria bacterium]MBW2210101.1 serine/threonine protein kinase [Deltaproteobacteria bacterium]MBW2684625.1 serine/threonine protein kinase [Deltaproteobacteria bacterium]
MNSSAGARLSRPMAGRQLGRYEILTQLASGGMASVYVARAQGVAGFERLVAIKVLHPHLAYEQEFISMFLDEARLAARIRHMNVVPTLDISDSPGDGYFLVMEYIEGDHLGALLGRAANKGERLPQPFVCRVLVDTLQGLSAAHRLTDEHGTPLKLVHRDVSPHNILIGTDGIARLTDFGVAKADVRMASTRAGQFKGKLSYMAPEQASSNETDQRSDLFSVGIILWESLTGRRLFKGESNAATLNKLLNDTIAKPSDLWPDVEPFDDVVMKALSRNPDGRFQSADEFGEALDDAAGRTGVAKTRDVAEVVRSLDADKLQDERQRVRDSIELLGRAEIALSKVPMPRERMPSGSQAYDQDAGTESHVHGSASGVLSDGTPVVVRTATPDSHALKWFVMVLAVVVFLYAGFLVLQLLRTTPAQGPVEPSPAAEVEPPPFDQAAEAVAAEPVVTQTEGVDAKKTDEPPDGAKQAPERKDSTPAPRARRRRAQPKSQRSPRSTSESVKPAEKARTRAPDADPADIDMQNPYRN